MSDRLVPFAKALTTQPAIHIPTKLDIRGTLPSWLSGVLYRQGPGKYDVELSDAAKKSNSQTHYNVQHWFDGLSMVHRFEIAGGTVLYRSRVCASGYEGHIKATGTPGITFGGRDPTSTFGRVSKVFRTIVSAPGEGNAGVTIAPDWPLPPSLASTVDFKSSDQIKTLVGKTDANFLMSLDPKTLEEKGGFSYTSYDSRLKGPLAPAHTHRDTKTGVTYSFVMDFGRQVTCKVFALVPSDAGTKTEILADFVPPYASYIHSFWQTESYLVLPFAPYWARSNGLSIVWNQNLTDALEWDPTKPVVFVVISKKEKKLVGKFQSEQAFWGFHTVNGFEVKGNKGTDLALDIVAAPNTNIVENLYLAKMRFESKEPYLSPTIYRVVLKNVESAAKLSSPSAPLSVVTEFATSEGGDLPRINPRFSCKPEYRYAYLLGSDTNPDGTKNLFATVRKVTLPGYKAEGPNTSTKLHSLTWNVPGVHPSEPVFVPTPGGTDEDDGILLVVCFNANDQSSFLAVLDAKTMTEIARAGWFGTAVGDGEKVGTHVVPVGFHGSFVEKL
ncbi:hypothetical protein HDU93_008265 [Gonapodya sp. JEL0774]|nr:hypothetical protein HDU93_008265 [Gonapodya sp. JEL0774]